MIAQNHIISHDDDAELTVTYAMLTCRVQLLNVLCYHTLTHTTILRPFFRDYPGEPVPEEKLLDFIMVQRKINRGSHHTLTKLLFSTLMKVNISHISDVQVAADRLTVTFNFTCTFDAGSQLWTNDYSMFHLDLCHKWKF